jgi:RNA polymerase sigma-70 factor (ECF subfamily)
MGVGSRSITFGKDWPIVSEAASDSDVPAVALSDEDEFGKFFVSNFGPLAAYCARLLPRAAAEDAAQETLVRVWTHWRTVRDPRAYAFLVATNLARRQWRAIPKQQPPAVLDAEIQARGEPYQTFELRDLVDRLPVGLRSPTLLHYFADLSTAEVARLMRRPPGTIRRQLGEARRLLGNALEENT